MILGDPLIERFTKPTDIILDTHVGSASSLIAAQALSRRFVGCELDSYYYHEALKRFQTESAQLTMFNLFGEI
jgi:site-specific DNA-methyltransferase (adenine-specific)